MRVRRILLILASCLLATVASAAARKQQPRIVKAVPQRTVPAGELVATGLQGKLTIQLPLEQQFSTMTCGDLTVRIGYWDTSQGGPNNPVFQEVGTALGTGVVSSGQCNYKVYGIPSGRPYRVWVNVTNWQKFVNNTNCNFVEVYQQPNQPDMTFSSGHMLVLDLKIGLHCDWLN